MAPLFAEAPPRAGRMHQANPPRETADHPHPRHRRWARWIGQHWARLHYARRVEPTWLELNRWDLPIAGLPAPFAGLKVVQLSDLHCSRHVTPAYVGEAVDLALAQQPDLVVLTGDFIHRGFRHVAEAASGVSRLTAPLGVYAVLGNHDYSIRNALGVRRFKHLHRAVADALGANGVRVLRNEAVRLERGGATLDLAGVDDLWSRACDPERAFAGLEESAPRLVLAHNPHTVERLGGRRCDLMLSGHTHGGQVDWPGLGRVVLSRRAKRFAAGLYRHGHTLLYVHKGVGFGWRFRFGVRPEVAVFTLFPAAEGKEPELCTSPAPGL